MTAMTARLLAALVVCSLAAGAGCCCYQTCGDPCGGPGCKTCCFSLPKPIVWNGACNECGPGPCESCADCPSDCGIVPLLLRSRTCGKGCGEVYWGEWVSDPPDCCDPCDPCHGCWTGPQGCCNLGPCQRLLAALHGYSYCPAPDCGPVCGLCNKTSCGPACGGAGCATCGGHAHGADIHYTGSPHPHLHGHPHHVRSHHGHPHPQVHDPSDPHILHENWDIPRPQPIPGKPIHKAQQPAHAQLSKAQPRPAAAQVARRAAQPQAIGSGVRQANYQAR